ncbi:hypothetical protein P171DRAFT_491958 [Karstenula rhodostoma CBS 690.94]|uniref:Uncharacterized protein n=1 Tax=Karstenula rhodostoma CBS 690.94 TaxID=1392251 RepID=A0A9P4U606_9PLEO|nr:hypothetical protein P171DRAFT_491958 [Karstenula rhodostoma CBS 690.94]
MAYLGLAKSCALVIASVAYGKLGKLAFVAYELTTLDRFMQQLQNRSLLEVIDKNMDYGRNVTYNEADTRPFFPGQQHQQGQFALFCEGSWTRA